ncbi:nephrin-like isoform X2 [Macrobrachium rosenbergii]|uniref:nephrin-like isoform X2 n=1 Tax=Macrobrachium rosenbergii TaxID=79674 RepID=UPI0034D5BEB3
MSKRNLELFLLYWISALHLGWSLPQSFRVAPQNVEVVAGNDVTLRCEVENQQGKAQWTKDGFALGFNRSIPGFPRYSVVGDESRGIHNLLITEVEIGDDGEYQCQVTPPSSGGGKAIRHAANLTVLLPPTSIEMVDHEPNAKITVKAGDSVTLQCAIRNAKPVSKVAWYRGNDPLRLDSQTDTKETSESDQNLKTLKTTITFRPTHTDNGVEYSCRAVHPALEDSNTQMVAKVRLDVHYEPGAPEITGYTEGEIVRAGDRKTLVCRARGGNPLPEVFWYKNGAQIDKNFNKHRNYAVNEYEFEVEASDNLAKYECHVMNSMTQQPKKAEIQLRVNFAASQVTISGPSEVKVGDIIAVSCIAENSNPPADVNLVINGQTPPGATSSTQKVDNGGWNTITNLTSYEVRPIDSDLTVNCYALNQALGSTKIDTMVISVLRPPEPPTILGYEPGRRLRKDDPQRLTCISNGGNPLATLKWFKGTQELQADTRHEGGSAISELNISLEESDNGAEYRCEATNPASPTPLINSTILHVMFPPSGVKVKARPRQIKADSQATLICESASSNPMANVTWWRSGFEVDHGDIEVKPGQYGGHTTKHSVRINVTSQDDGAVFTCQADNRVGPTTHDAVTLSVRFPPVWKSSPKDSMDVSEGENVVVNVSAVGNPNSVTYIWKRYDEVVMSGSFLNISSVTKDQAGFYTVEATNEEGTSVKNISINVKYAPTIMEVSGGRNLTQGETVTLLCKADASPSPEIKWQREGYNFSKAHHEKHPTKDLMGLTIKNVTFEDTGIFTCVAKNGIGEPATANATIVVKHKPIIDQSPRFQKAAAEAGGNARLICRASGAPYVSFTWFTRDNTPIEKAIYARFDNRYLVEEPKLIDGLVTYESVLLVKNVSNKDYGFFECQARNPLGSSRTAIHLDGTSKPDPPMDLKVLNFTHDSVTLIWTPGFDGGLIQNYRVRFAIAGSTRYQYADAYPENVTIFTVYGLTLGTTYSFSVLAYNSKGESEYTKDEVQATTESTAPPTETPPTGSTTPGTRVSGLIVIIITLVGAALLVLNVALVACFIKRRARKRLTASSDKGSSKSTTIEMYAPSSYTGTVTGETLSSISEKSRESYAHEDSADEYEAEAARVTAASTYLIEQLEPPPQYATRPPPHILPPPPSHNDLNIDDGYDDIRRNQYNAALDRASGYGTLGRRNNTTDHYNITNAEGGHYSLQTHRYNTYQPPNHTTSLTAHTHAHNQNTDSLRRNPPSKLHFPKDYIRNGSMNIPVTGSAAPSSAAPGGGGGGGLGGKFPNKPQSPTRTHPPHTPMLTTFASDPTQPTSGVPLEHRGHLV